MRANQLAAAVTIVSLGIAAPVQAFAYQWIYLADSKELMGSTGEEEGDTDFRATCKGNGKAVVGIGAQDGVGEGKGEAVSVTLASAKHSVKIDGRSGKSLNFEMTGGVELQAEVDAAHAVFQVLADAGAIKVTGAARPMSWPAAGRAKATASFMKACFGK